jgi:hypothetical protein
MSKLTRVAHPRNDTDRPPGPVPADRMKLRTGPAVLAVSAARLDGGPAGRTTPGQGVTVIVTVWTVPPLPPAIG